ncbi:hypothetical protein LEAN103870_07245 [Legionella anisa]|nr:hypothetical protein [Legionella anisa]KTC68609.1 hypothetical protein Lani_2896 [Legionella anisa]MBN5937598.1 hypothetical protein [Legionella anisa]
MSAQQQVTSSDQKREAQKVADLLADVAKCHQHQIGSPNKGLDKDVELDDEYSVIRSIN